MSAAVGQAPRQSAWAAIRSAPVSLSSAAAIDDDLGPGLGEEPDLGRSLRAAADDDDPAAGDLVEGREDGELAGMCRTFSRNLRALARRETSPAETALCLLKHLENRERRYQRRQFQSAAKGEKKISVAARVNRRD